MAGTHESWEKDSPTDSAYGRPCSGATPSVVGLGLGRSMSRAAVRRALTFTGVLLDKYARGRGTASRPR